MKKEIIEIYTPSGTLNNITEIMKVITEIKKSYTGYNYEPLVRYVCEYKGTKYLAELDVPTKECLELNPQAEMDIAIYSFVDDDIKNYSAEFEIDILPFDISRNFKTVIQDIKNIIYDIVD